MGTMVESLELGCDCLGEIVYLDDQQLRYANNDKHTRNAPAVHAWTAMHRAGVASARFSARSV